MNFETIKTAFTSVLGGFNLMDSGDQVACFGSGREIWVLREDGEERYALCERERKVLEFDSVEAAQEAGEFVRSNLVRFVASQDGKSEVVLVTPSGHRNGITIVQRGESGRKVEQGPLVPGPWADTFGLCTVMAANPEHGTSAEMARLRGQGLVYDVRSGDLLCIDGVIYRVKVYRRQYIALTEVESN